MPNNIQLIRNCFEWQYLSNTSAMEIVLIWSFGLKRFIYFTVLFCCLHFIATLSRSSHRIVFVENNFVGNKVLCDIK